MRASCFYRKHQKYFIQQKLKCCLQSTHFNRWAVCSTAAEKEGNELHQSTNRTVGVTGCSTTHRAPDSTHGAPAQVREYSVFFRTNLQQLLTNDSMGKKKITRTNFCCSVVNDFHAQSPAHVAPNYLVANT